MLMHSLIDLGKFRALYNYYQEHIASLIRLVLCLRSAALHLILQYTMKRKPEWWCAWQLMFFGCSVHSV